MLLFAFEAKCKQQDFPQIALFAAFANTYGVKVMGELHSFKNVHTNTISIDYLVVKS